MGDFKQGRYQSEIPLANEHSKGCERRASLNFVAKCQPTSNHPRNDSEAGEKRRPRLNTGKRRKKKFPPGENGMDGLPYERPWVCKVRRNTLPRYLPMLCLDTRCMICPSQWCVWCMWVGDWVSFQEAVFFQEPVSIRDLWYVLRNFCNRYFRALR